MGSPSAGSLVIVHFPFSDLSATKVRPAVVLAKAGGDFLLCQVTSKSYSDRLALEIAANDFQEGSLQKTSYARPLKLFTASTSLIVGEVARLRPESFNKKIRALISVLKNDVQ